MSIAVLAAAKSALEATNEPLQAKRLLHQQLDTDHDLQLALAQYGANVAVDAAWRAGRQHRWANYEAPVAEIVASEPSFGAPTAAVTEPARIAPIAEVYRRIVSEQTRRLMEWEMEPSSGKRLGDYTTEEIRRYATRLMKQAEAIRAHGCWLMRVADLMPRDQPNLRVRDVLRETDLRREMRRAAA